MPARADGCTPYSTFGASARAAINFERPPRLDITAFRLDASPDRRFGAAITAYFAFFSIRLVVESFQFGDVSPGMVPVPLWLPQTAIAVGLVMLAIAFVDEFISVLKGNSPSYETTAESTRASAPTSEQQ